MKVLVTGRAIPKQPDRCTGQQLVEGFRQAGHDCVFYGNFYGKQFTWLGVEEATTQEFDLVVVTEMNDGHADHTSLFCHLNLKDTPRLYWDFDVSYHPDTSYARASKIPYDGYLVGNKYYCGSDAFGRFNKPVLHLPYACSPQIHRHLDTPREYIIGFVGSLTEERNRLMEVCRKAANKYSDVFTGDNIFGDDLITYTNLFHIMFHNNQDACKGLVPGRPWETAGCGTALLMDQTSYIDFAEFIPEDYREAIFMYRDEDDIYRIIKQQQDQPASLWLESNRLMTYVHENHSYKNRAERIIEWAKEQKILTH